ncbi:MAG: adenosylmethionine--8-amino-7-oxononanoate transaminase [Actinobacteria bacterium]|nr:adenosylmethionine--8-amino-7-oxononanoate transaminase [Actinomycetota bacterium]
MSLAADDRRYLWHPFTQQRGWEAEEPLVVAEADGCWLIDEDGRRYIDGVSSLWCTVHGHRHPILDLAVKDQLDRVAHTTLLGLTHAPAVDLARELIAIAPDGLTRVFYSDSGSAAVEIALKMAFQYWQQQGGPNARRTRFVSLENAYHGDTLGSVSVGGIDVFHSAYRPLLFDGWRVPAGDAAAMERVLAEHGEEVAAVIVEPLVQGAAGMAMQPPGYLRSVRELCNHNDVLLICDEVATGFGRTGRMFACEHEGISPDLMCLGKGITAGYLPLAATLTCERVYEGFLGEHEELRTFFHGHTYTGNPLACAAGLASLQLFEQERTLEQLQPKVRMLANLLKPIGELPAVADVRQRGFMCGIELAGFPAEARIGHQVTLEARARGVVVRPLGDVVVLMPPLAIPERELRTLVEVVRDSIEAAVSAHAAASTPLAA